LLIYMRVPRKPTPPPVDPGVWERKWDLDSGLSFYENSVSGERSFDKPKAYDRLALAAANAVARKAAATQAAHTALAEAAALESSAGPGDALASGAYSAYPGQGAPLGGPEKRRAELPPGVHSWKDYKESRKRKKLKAKHAWLFDSER
jgi:hypothetical protein